MKNIIFISSFLAIGGMGKSLPYGFDEDTLEGELEAQLKKSSVCRNKSFFCFTVSDVKAFFGDLGKAVADTELQAVERGMDINGNGSVDLEEFTRAWTPPIPDALLKLRFSTYDLDNNGFFDVNEYKRVLAVLGQLKTDRQFPFYAFYDKNKDGKVSFEEYRRGAPSAGIC